MIYYLHKQFGIDFMDSVTCLKSSSRQNDVNLVNYDHIQSKTDNLLDGMAKKSDNPPQIHCLVQIWLQITAEMPNFKMAVHKQFAS